MRFQANLNCKRFRPRTRSYQTESPDETALVVAAKVLGFYLYRRSSDSVWVKERNLTVEKDI